MVSSPIPGVRVSKSLVRISAVFLGIAGFLALVLIVDGIVESDTQALLWGIGIAAVTVFTALLGRIALKPSRRDS
jgi:hypothetical protein